MCMVIIYSSHYLCAFVGIKEVKTLVDLAMMSAQGQGAMEVQKVSCLHAAATGYGPLIYELQEDAGFKVFLGQCKLVWRALKKDKNLPQHLVSGIELYVQIIDKSSFNLRTTLSCYQYLDTILVFVSFIALTTLTCKSDRQVSIFPAPYQRAIEFGRFDNIIFYLHSIFKQTFCLHIWY